MGIRDKARGIAIWITDIILAVVILIYALVKLAKDGDGFAISVLIAIVCVISIMVLYFMFPQIVTAIMVIMLNPILRALGF